jgi:HEAT repeat protein
MKRFGLVIVTLIGVASLWGLFFHRGDSSRDIGKLLNHADPLISVAAYDAISQIQPLPLKELLGLLKLGNEEERVGVLMVLRRVPSKAQLAVPEIISALEDSNPTVRRGAARCLGAFGTNAILSLAHLKIATQDKDSAVALDAALAFWKITGETQVVLSTATNVMGNLSNTDLQNLIRVLGKMGDLRAVPTLESMLNHPRRDIRYASCEALATLDLKNDKWIPGLITILKEDSRYGSAVISFLEMKAPTSKEAFAAIVFLENESDPTLRRLGVRAVDRLKSSPLDKGQ